MKVVYSTQKVPGHKAKNPREFRGPVEGAKEVYIDGDWPAVREAYEKIEGVKILDISQLKSAPVAKAQ